MTTTTRGVRIGFLAIALTTIASPAPAQQLEALWYSVRGEQSTSSFVAHAAQISIVSPQVFSMNSRGVITGQVDPRVVSAARANGVKLIPLVMNPGFDQPTIHRVLTVADARRRAVANLVALCQNNHFDGLQFDIENVNVRDKDAFTSFVRESAIALHRIGCSVSAAVVPRSSDSPGTSNYHRWMFENWRGVYDYKPLADALDFISFMTYAQHTGGSTPGPVAGYTWMEEALQYVLSLGVPPAKISLGIPSYSDWWYSSYDKKNGARMRGNDISYVTAAGLMSKFGVTPVWDEHEKSPYAFWSNNGVYEWLWLEDARSFMAKLELVRKYKLRGYSVWVLGLEDPKTWDALASVR